MDQKTDVALVTAATGGDERAFETLIRRYEQLIAGVIRRYVRDTHRADDVLQETLLQAWSGISRVRDSDAVGSWLARIARNRSLDELRSAGHRQQPTDSDELEMLVSRYGRDTVRSREIVSDAFGALERAPEGQRDAARLFYLNGFTIDEIAERRGMAAGTVKRYLHDARVRMRRELGVPEPLSKEYPMKLHKVGSKRQPFPARRPEIRIAGSDEAPFTVDNRELVWWFIVPELGERVDWCTYDPVDGDAGQWNITSVTRMDVVGPAKIHDLDGVEIVTQEWYPGQGWRPRERTIYGRLTEEKAEWLALSNVEDGKRVFESYLDEGLPGWGPTVRRTVDAGRYRELPDGGLELVDPRDGEIGAGRFDVTVGDQTRSCLRVIDVDRLDERGSLMEGFLTKEGRTLLCRRYNAVNWNVGSDKHYKEPWDQRLPESNRLVVNGVTYVHWYDCLPGWALDVSE